MSEKGLFIIDPQVGYLIAGGPGEVVTTQATLAAAGLVAAYGDNQFIAVVPGGTGSAMYLNWGIGATTAQQNGSPIVAYTGQGGTLAYGPVLIPFTTDWNNSGFLFRVYFNAASQIQLVRGHIL